MGLTKVVLTNVTATCDVCGYKLPMNNQSRQKNISTLKKDGWIVGKHGHPLTCPKCVKKGIKPIP